MDPEIKFGCDYLNSVCGSFLISEQVHDAILELDSRGMKKSGGFIGGKVLSLGRFKCILGWNPPLH